MAGKSSSSKVRTSPRTLSDDLRRRDDASLAALLRARADLLDPVPADLSRLAARASSTPSVVHALDGLDRAALQVLDTLAALPGPVTLGALANVIGTDHAFLSRASSIVHQLRERALVWGDEPTSEGATLNVVVAVREVLRGGSIIEHIDLGIAAPEPTSKVDPALCEQACGEQAYGALATVEALCDRWSVTAPPVLRAGGVGVRDVALAAKDLGCDEVAAAFWIELAVSADLIGRDGEIDERYRPTTKLDSWLDQPAPLRWATLAIAWARSTRLSDDSINDANQRSNPLSPGLERPVAPRLRHDVLKVMGDCELGSGVDRSEIIRVLDDRLPRRRGNLRDGIVTSTLREATLLGLVGFESLSEPGRLIADSHDGIATEAVELCDHVAAAIGRTMPLMIDHFLIQGDLTAIVPGPPEPHLRRCLSLLADMESTGGAVVYRMTAQSLDRAVATGWSADQILDFLGRHSRTSIPQALEYLVGDAQRRHGEARGAAPKLISMLRAPAAGERMSGIHVAPDAVLVGAVVRALRCGDEVLHEVHVPDVNMPADHGQPVSLAEHPGDVPRMATAQTATVLRAAMTLGGSVWIGYADNAGTTSRRLLDPIRMEGGYVSALDHRSGQVRSFAISRIVGAVAVPANSAIPSISQ